jgi:hypothetical protein
VKEKYIRASKYILEKHFLLLIVGPPQEFVAIVPWSVMLTQLL